MFARCPGDMQERWNTSQDLCQWHGRSYGVGGGKSAVGTGMAVDCATVYVGSNHGACKG
jgi:hypothetical protein